MTSKEYRKKVIRQTIFYGIFLLLIGGLVVGYRLAAKYYPLKINVDLQSSVNGFMVGSAAVFLLYIFRNAYRLKKPTALNKARIKENDERNLEVAKNSLAVSAFVQLLALAILVVIGSFIDALVVELGILLIWVFLVSYLLGWFYYRHKM